MSQTEKKLKSTERDLLGTRATEQAAWEATQKTRMSIIDGESRKNRNVNEGLNTAEVQSSRLHAFNTRICVFSGQVRLRAYVVFACAYAQLTPDLIPLSFFVAVFVCFVFVFLCARARRVRRNRRGAVDESKPL